MDNYNKAPPSLLRWGGFKCGVYKNQTPPLWAEGLIESTLKIKPSAKSGGFDRVHKDDSIYDYFENTCWDISVEGRPGNRYPFSQSFVVVAEVVVEFGDHEKLLLPSNVPPVAPGSLRSAMLNVSLKRLALLSP